MYTLLKSTPSAAVVSEIAQRLWQNRDKLASQLKSHGISLDALKLAPHKAGVALLPGAALFGAGLAVGVGAGLLFAPKKGEELRSDLKRVVGAGLQKAKSGAVATWLARRVPKTEPAEQFREEFGSDTHTPADSVGVSRIAPN